MDATGHIQDFKDATHNIVMLVGSLTPNRIIAAGLGEEVPGDNFVQGYEVNYGFWSKNSFHRHSYKEMFEIKYGREPTPEELASITCEDAKKWFIDEYTQEYWFSIEKPKDVKCVSPPYKKYCISMFYDQYDYSGYVEFSNGIQCKIKPFTIYKDSFDQDEYLVKIKKPCSACL